LSREKPVLAKTKGVQWLDSGSPDEKCKDVREGTIIMNISPEEMPTKGEGQEVV